MAIRGFVLGIVLLALVGWCMVQESVTQTRARYRLAELARREAELKERLARLKTEEESLRSPARLATRIKETKAQLVVLRTAPPESSYSSDMAMGRQPGQVLDESFIRAEKPVTIAAAGEW